VAGSKSLVILIRDRDRAYGEIFIRRARSIGIQDRPTSFRSPWQNGYAERLIGSIRRECIDHVVVLGDRHLRHVLLSYKHYYNATRTHLSLNKDAPFPRGVALPPDPGRTAPSIWPDVIYGRHSRFAPCHYNILAKAIENKRQTPVCSFVNIL
jgi:transposase InsO family protein